MPPPTERPPIHMRPDLPPALIEAVEAALGPDARISRVERVGGGDINEAVEVTTDTGDRRFLKWNPSPPPGMFAAEADGLEALAAAAASFAPRDLVVPGVLASGTAGGVAWLLLEFVETGAGVGGDEWASRLGRGLAALHRGTAVPGVDPGTGTAEARAFGWRRDNFIGRLPQSNGPCSDWARFWRDRRIAPQVRRAVDAGRVSGTDRTDLDRLLDRIGDALAGAAREGASLLHGDLWGGNAMRAADGRAAIYDPAVYLGHREVDLAMSELFGFPPDFLPAYRDAWPVEEAYASHRRDLYQLYYLLVHVNLFGAGYLGRTMRAARTVLARI